MVDFGRKLSVFWSNLPMLTGHGGTETSEGIATPSTEGNQPDLWQDPLVEYGHLHSRQCKPPASMVLHGFFSYNYSFVSSTIK